MSAARNARRRERRRVSLVMAQRPCGECDACCTAMGVEALDKPHGVACRHLRARGGCGVYSSRPGECRRYDCLWRKSHLPASARPDRSGVVFTHHDEPVAPGVHVTAHEAWPGAFDAAGDLLQLASRIEPIALVGEELGYGMSAAKVIGQ